MASCLSSIQHPASVLNEPAHLCNSTAVDEMTNKSIAGIAFLDCLQDWLRHWPREQLLFLRFEDYKASLAQHLQAVLTFLGMRVPTGEDAGRWSAMLDVPVSNKKDHPAMQAATRTMLQVSAPGHQPHQLGLTWLIVHGP